MSTAPGPSPRLLRRLAGVWLVVGIVVLLWFLITFLSRPFRLLITPVLLAGVLVYLLSPVVERLARRLPRVLATVLTYVLVIGLLALGGWLLLPVLNAQLQALVEGLPAILDSTQTSLVAVLDPIGLAGIVPVAPAGGEGGEWLAGFFDGEGQVVGVLAVARSLLGSVVAGVVSLVLAPVLAFYTLADLPRLSTGLQRLLPPDVRDEVTDVGNRIVSAVGAYFRGQLLVATFVGVATAIGLALVGLPFWAIVGGLAGLFNLIPLVGPFVGGALGVIVALTTGGGISQAVVVVVVMVLVQQVDNHVITPQVIGRTVHVHPITIILALSVAASAMGIIGMLVAIPIVAAIKLVTLYVLATRVPSMRHLSDPDRFLDDSSLPPAEEGSLGALSQQLRRAWESRRFGGGSRGGDDHTRPPD